MTVQELIDILNHYDKTKTVVIDDADTNWYLNINSVSDEKVIVISGNYMNEYEDSTNV